MQADPNFAPPICILGLIDAGLGQKKEALEEAQRFFLHHAEGERAMLPRMRHLEAWALSAPRCCCQARAEHTRPAGSRSANAHNTQTSAMFGSALGFCTRTSSMKRWSGRVSAFQIECDQGPRGARFHIVGFDVGFRDRAPHPLRRTS